MTAYDARQGLYLPQFGNAILGGIEKAQDIRKNQQLLGQNQIMQNLQREYVNAQDDRQKRDILQQMAVYNPEHAKGIAGIATLGMNPFEGSSLEAQKANLQYQRYRAAGYSDGEARLNAINDAASTSAQYYTDVGGNRVTVGGLPLPDVGGKTGSRPTSRPLLGASLPSYENNVSMTPAEEAAAKLPINDYLGDVTPEERSFVSEVMSSPRPAKIYNTKVAEHPELAAVYPQWNNEVAGYFQEINTALGKSAPKTNITDTDMNLPVVKVTAAKAQAEKDVALGNIQPGTAAKLEEKLLSASDIRSKVTNIKSSFKPEYQTYKVQGNMAWNALKDKFDSKSLNKNEQQSLSDFTAYRMSSAQMFSDVLRDLSGAAVNPSEFERAKAYLPNTGTGVFDGDSPTQMDSKIKKMQEFTDKALAKYSYIRKNGFDVDAVDVDQMPKIMNDRGAAIAKDLSARGLKGNALKSAVINQLATEFGLAQ